MEKIFFGLETPFGKRVSTLFCFLLNKTSVEVKGDKIPQNSIEFQESWGIIDCTHSSQSKYYERDKQTVFYSVNFHVKNYILLSS